MPMEFRFDPEKNALFGTVSGQLTLEDFQASIETIVRSKEFPPDIKTLWDLRNLEFKEIDRGFEEGIVGISENIPERGSPKVAIIVGDELGLGKATLFEKIAKRLGYQIIVFKSYSEGEKWLLRD